MSLYSSLTQVLAPYAAKLNGLLTGYDGTTYSSPGEAVRTQISDLHVLIGDEPGTAIQGEAVSYDGTESGLTATTVQDAIDESAAALSSTNERLNYLPYSKYSVNSVTDGIYLDADGEEHTQNGWSVSDYLAIGESATFYIKTGVASNTVKSCFYDEDRAFVSSFKTGTKGQNTITTPSGVRYVRFSIQTADKADFQYSSTLFIDAKTGCITPNLISDTVLNRTITNELIAGKYYTANGSVGNNTAWAMSELVPVAEGDVLTVDHAAHQVINYFDSEKAFVSSVSATAGVDTSVTATVPSGVAYVGFNALLTLIDGFACYKNGQPINAKYTLGWLDIATSIWANKTYISHGDSITWQDGNKWGSGSEQGQVAKGYQTIFSRAVGLKSYSNQGKSGWSMAVVNSNGVVNTILGVADYSIYDLCTIACGTNDFKLNVPLGTLGVIGDTTFDDTTFYGAFRKAVEYILTNSPTIRLVLLTPLQRDNAGYDVNYTNSAGHKLIDYVNAVKEIGEMYGLPVCDMYANSGFTKKTLSTYTLDGLHPNSAGYKRMGNYLTGFLNAVGN